MKYFWSYWKLSKLKRGISVNIDITYRCNLQCANCKAELAGKGIPIVPEKSPEEWIEFIKRFPAKNIKQIVISGGEPTLYYGLHILINWLTCNGYLVTIATNIWRPEELLKINPSRRLEIWDTYHIRDDVERFDKAHKELEKKFQMSTREYSKPKKLSYSIPMDFFLNIDHWGCHLEEFVISPDMRIFASCAEEYKDRALRVKGF
jgi:organic radical activating enzyme